MAKVRVAALAKGWDGTVRRNPGDEFYIDEAIQGKGKWYEYLDDNPRTVEHSDDVLLDDDDDKPKKGSKKKRSKKDDDRLA